MSTIEEGACITVRNCHVDDYEPEFLSSTFCSRYDTSGSTWPLQAFPATDFLRRYSSSDLRDARIAWNLFEQVEAQDAATRVRLAAAPWEPPSGEIQNPCIWYQFASNEERLTYMRGRALHAELCPDYKWISQRHRGLTPPINVYPLKN
jgi:hypothetical protein